MRSKLVKDLKSLHAVPVENGGCRPGTPDINCTLGWIELKWRRGWPVRDGVVVLPHPYTKVQQLWARRRERAGESVFVLVKIAQCWMLFSSSVASRVLGHTNEEELRQAALFVSDKHLAVRELIECLRSNRSSVR